MDALNIQWTQSIRYMLSKDINDDCKLDHSFGGEEAMKQCTYSCGAPLMSTIRIHTYYILSFEYPNFPKSFQIFTLKH